MAQVVEQVPLDQETKSVLLNGEGKLRPIYQLTLAQEAGNWEAARESAEQLRISESEVAALWWEAMQWARRVSVECSA
jgi:c-di-GMP-related signal transduction protein